MDTIAKLSDEEAQRAVLNLFDLIPETFWAEGKPSTEDIKSIAGDAGAPLAALESESDASKGEVARAVLRSFAASEQASALVDKAVAEATGPRLFPLPLLIVPMLIVLAGIDIDFTVGKTRLKLTIPGSGKDLLKNLAAFAKELPAGVWTAVAKGVTGGGA
jgi:hypothetical protein